MAVRILGWAGMTDEQTVKVLMRGVVKAVRNDSAKIRKGG
jgi:hypothetical protein